MEWARQEYGGGNDMRMLGLVVLFLLLALGFQSYLLTGMLTFLTVFLVLQRIYMQQTGKGLSFQNERSRSRLLKGQEASWKLTFSNRGLPIIGGRLKITFHDAVVPLGGGAGIHGGYVEKEIPFSIGRNERLEVDIPIAASRRGLARIRKMEVTVPHLFGEEQLILEYRPMIRQEYVVYPLRRSEPVRSFPAPQMPGTAETRHSLYTDAFQPVGTRDYQPTDQFSHIHWKASARTQQYQTKVFAHIANDARLLCLDVTMGRGISSGLEERLEQLAGMIEDCHRKQIPFAIAINVRAAGKVPFLYLPVREGARHRMQALELLAVLPPAAATIPFDSMLSYIDTHMELPPAVYYLSDQDHEKSVMKKKWARKVQTGNVAAPTGRGSV